MSQHSYNPKVYFLRHMQVMLASLGQLWRQPIASLMTILVIAIALTLPAGLYVLLTNLNQVSNGWDDASHISLFLKKEVDDKQAIQLVELLKTWPEISKTNYQSANESLEEFRQLSGMSTLLDSLPTNPLPAVIIVTPSDLQLRDDAIGSLLTRLEALKEVEIAQLDMEWLQRLRAISDIAREGINILAALLSLSVLLVIGNTIRLSILSRQTEIKVIKLVGGTDAFVRRPFLYTGFWYGLLGGALAWLTLIISLSILDGPIQHIAELYNSQFTLIWQSAFMFLFLPLCGMLLGVLGAWIATGRHLSAIEPS